MAETVIIDIDGTLADNSHRQHYLTGPKKDWDSFYAGCARDVPIGAIVRLAQALDGAGFCIVICSGRRESCRDDTIEWLERNDIYWSKLLLRPDGDHRPDEVIKREMLNKLRSAGHKIAFAIDDRRKVVDMWRAEGLVCLQAAPGEF